jgi:hypothetical protein
MRGMATSRYTIAPPSVAPLLHEFGDWEKVPDQAWDEYCAAVAYWSRSRRMYAGQGEGRQGRKQKQTSEEQNAALSDGAASAFEEAQVRRR